MLRILTWLPPVLIVLGFAGWLQFYLPSYDIVRIVNTDIKRVDSSGFFDSESPGATQTSTRDVRFINGAMPDGDPRVYRNEDTGWSFPPYFKFSSGDLHAEAQALISTAEAPVWVRVTHYGWRFSYLTVFPNAVAVERVTGPDATVIPWFNIIFLSVIAFVLLWIIFRIRRFKEDRIDPLMDSVDARLDGMADAVDGGADAVRGRWRRWFGLGRR